MSRLVDEIIKDEHFTNCTAKFSDGWFIAKPEQYSSLWNLKRKISDIWRVITNRGFVVHYKIDDK